MLNKILVSFACSLVVSTVCNAASIAWSATQDNGLGRVGPVADLPMGNLIRLGTFNTLTDSQILTNFNIGNIAALESDFTQGDTAIIGEGTGVASLFAKNSSVNTATLGLVGKQIYFWAYASSDNSTVTNSKNTAFQMGIFYADKSLLGSWAFPVQTPVPGSTSIDLSDLTNPAGTALVAAAHVVVGSFPSGTSSATSSPNFGLAPVVPEPAAGLLLMLGLAGLAARRRSAHTV